MKTLLTNSLKGTLVAGTCVLLLSGCGGNPLAKLDKKERIQVLAEASKVASVRDFHSRGYYENCVLYSQAPVGSCDDVYKKMIAYLKPKIGKVTKKDLTDQKLLGDELHVITLETYYIYHPTFRGL